MQDFIKSIITYFPYNSFHPQKTSNPVLRFPIVRFDQRSIRLEYRCICKRRARSNQQRPQFGTIHHLAPALQNWLVVSTPLKNISQNGSLPQIGVKTKNIWNHHLENVLEELSFLSRFLSWCLKYGKKWYNWKCWNMQMGTWNNPEKKTRFASTWNEY